MAPAPQQGAPVATADPAQGERVRVPAPSPRALVPGVREALLALVGLTVLAVVVYGSHVWHGGFYNDDWINSGLVDGGVKQGHLEHVNIVQGHRPLLVFYLPYSYALFGFHTKWFLAFALAIGVLGAWAAFALARRLGAGTWPAAAIAALVLVFPFADAVRHWIGASGMSLSLALFLFAGVVTSSAFARGRRGLVLHVASVALLVASVMLFEIAIGLVGIGVLAYLRWAAPRAAVVRWLVDLAVTGVVLLVWTTAKDNSYERKGLGEALDNAWRYAQDAVALLGSTLWPIGGLQEGVGIACILALGVLVALAVRRPALRPWAYASGAGLLLIAAAYLPFVFGDILQYRPIYEGGQNRVNVVAALGYATTVVALVGGLVALAGGRRPALVAGAVAMAAIIAGNAVRTAENGDDWDRAYERARTVLTNVTDAYPVPPPRALVLTFEHPGARYPGFPELGGRVDATWALRRWYRRDDIEAGVALQGVTVDCGPRGIVVHGPFVEGLQGRYGATLFISGARPEALLVDTPRRCRDGLAYFKQAPVFERGPQRQ
jgi:hypothetical protein